MKPQHRLERRHALCPDLLRHDAEDRQRNQFQQPVQHDHDQSKPEIKRVLDALQQRNVFRMVFHSHFSQRDTQRDGDNDDRHDVVVGEGLENTAGYFAEQVFYRIEGFLRDRLPLRFEVRVLSGLQLYWRPRGR